MPINPCFISAGATARLDRTPDTIRTIFPILGDIGDSRFSTRIPQAEGELGFGLINGVYRLYCAVRLDPADTYFTWVPTFLYQGPPTDLRTGSTWTSYPRLKNEAPL